MLAHETNRRTAMTDRKTIRCTEVESDLAELLLSPEQVSAPVLSHVAECAHCRAELDELRATMAMLDGWQAPEPDPYFMTRFGARLREEKQAAPKSLWARWRVLMMGTAGRPLRPVAAMALTVLLLVGGGSYLDLDDWTQPQDSVTAQAPVVHDLETLDTNAQLLDQLEDLSNNGGN